MIYDSHEDEIVRNRLFIWHGLNIARINQISKIV